MPHWAKDGRYRSNTELPPEEGCVAAPGEPPFRGCLLVDGEWTVTNDVRADARDRIDVAYDPQLAAILSPHLGISCYLLGQVLQAIVLKMTADPAPTAGAYRGLQSLVVEGRAATLAEAADVALGDLTGLMYYAGPVNDARLAAKQAVSDATTLAEIQAVLP